MSTQSIGVEFGGLSPLVSDTDYQWTVRWQDERGAWSKPSAPARFSTGLLAPANADWIGTAWIGGLHSTDDRNQLRHAFSLPADTADVQRARCYISAPGGHETYLNGARLQNSARSGSEGAALGPTVQFSSKIPYEVYDCTQALRSGGAQNVLATTLGRGWFAMADYGGLGYSTIGARWKPDSLNMMPNQWAILQDGEFRLMVGSGSDAGVRSHANINPLACGCMSTRRCAHCVHFLMCLLQEIQRCLTNCPKRCNGSPRNRLDLQDEGVTEGEGEGSS